MKMENNISLGIYFRQTHQAYTEPPSDLRANAAADSGGGDPDGGERRPLQHRLRRDR